MKIVNTLMAAVIAVVGAYVGVNILIDPVAIWLCGATVGMCVIALFVNN